MLRSPRVACFLLLVGLLTAWTVPVRAEEGAGDLAADLDEGQSHLSRGEKVGGEVSAPKVLKHVQPLYTNEACRARLQGTGQGGPAKPKEAHP